MSRLHPPRRRDTYKVVPKVKKDYFRKTVLAKVRGRKGVLAMAAREAARQLGRSKGGRRRVELGKGHTWTKEEARLAGIKSHQKGSRRRSARRKAAVDHAAARALHTALADTNLLQGTWYIPVAKRWLHNGICIAERTALRHLGYIAFPRKGLMPEKIVSATPGSPFIAGSDLASSPVQGG